jgi:mono/diheme cytochrome c family protein
VTKYINFLGLQVPIFTDDEIAEASREGPNLYLVARVADTDPRQGSPALRQRRYTVHCTQCHDLCWLDPDSFGKLAGPATIVCLVCAPAYMKDNPISDKDPT